ncbi:MAG: hypothetical protein H7066_17650, partial [Cytophagaceae bacterium]|nr:hypothetical protein [Gemmatimonadaceae bacterium]
AWQQVVVGANNTYTFNIGASGGTAWVTQGSNNSYALTVYYGTTAELQGLGTQCNTTTPNTKSVTGTVAGLTSQFETATLSLGGGTGSANFAVPAFTITGIPNGTLDLVGVRSAIDIQNPTGMLANRVYLQRGLNPANGSSLGTIDFAGSANSFAPDTRTFTVATTAGEALYSLVQFTTGTASNGTLGLSTSSTSPVNMPVVPASRTAAGDLHLLNFTAYAGSFGSHTAMRSILTYFRDPTNQTIALGPSLSTPTVSLAASAPYPRFRTQTARQTEYASTWLNSFTQGSSSGGRTVVMLVSPGYVGNATTIDVTLPDFTGVGGWLNTYGPLSGTTANWTVSASGVTGGNAGVAEGLAIRSAYRLGTLNTP